MTPARRKQGAAECGPFHSNLAHVRVKENVKVVGTVGTRLLNGSVSLMYQGFWLFPPALLSSGYKVGTRWEQWEQKPVFPPSLSVVPTCTHQVLPKWEQHKPSNGAGWRGVVPTFPPFPPLFSYIEREQPIKITLLPLQGHSPTEAPSGWPVCRPHAEGSGCATWTQSPESSGDWSSPQSPESSGDWPLSPIGRDFGQSNRYPQSAEMSADQHPTPQRHALADPPG